MTCNMPFGTRQQISDVPAPIAPFKHTMVRGVGNTSRFGGAPFVNAGPQTYQTFEMSWLAPYVEVAPVLEALGLNDGPPYYFLDPAALDNPGEFNALPPHWAAPGIYSKSNPTMYLSGTNALVSPKVADLNTYTTARVGSSSWGAPNVGVSFKFKTTTYSPPANVGMYDGGALPYQLASSPGPNGDVYSYANPSATLLIPPGYVVGLWVSGVFTGAGLQLAIASSSSGSLAGVLRTGGTVQVPSSGEQAFYVGNGTDWSMVDVGFGAAAGAGAHTFTLFGMSAYYFKVGDTNSGVPASFTRAWSKGRGHMPLWLGDGGVNLDTYQAFSPERTGVSLSLTEGFIPW